MTAFEINFDGIVGPTHNYGGLSLGNVASRRHASQISNPKEAALQGLKKMKLVADMGIRQAVLPPHERPHIPTLRRLGFRGSDTEILRECQRTSPRLLVHISSASAMWTANAATVAPSADTADGKVHLTPANLAANFHRAIEAPTTTRILKAIFNDPDHFVVHQPLPGGRHLGDEGAANHTRLCPDLNGPGIELFVFGRHSFSSGKPRPSHYPARQTDQAARAVVRLHRLDPQKTVLAQQNPFAVDAGVFHNDVIAVGHRNIFLFHEQAYLNPAPFMAELTEKYQALGGDKLHLIKISTNDVTVQEAVETYLFNSQIVGDEKEMTLIAPKECEENPPVKKCIDHLIESKDNPISKAVYIDLKQSMQNGGGPACLRLRVVLTEQEASRIRANVFFTDQLYETLTAWVKKHYRDRLAPKDLADPALLTESRTALDELSGILKIGSVFEFQR